MNYYVIAGLDNSGADMFLAVDPEDNNYYWATEGLDANVVKFQDVEGAVLFAATVKEFTQSINTGTAIIEPILLANMQTDSIDVKQLSYFVTVQPLDFTLAMDQYKTRKASFEAKKKELTSI